MWACPPLHPPLCPRPRLPPIPPDPSARLQTLTGLAPRLPLHLRRRQKHQKQISIALLLDCNASGSLTLPAPPLFALPGDLIPVPLLSTTTLGEDLAVAGAGGAVILTAATRLLMSSAPPAPAPNLTPRSLAALPRSSGDGVSKRKAAVAPSSPPLPPGSEQTQNDTAEQRYEPSACSGSVYSSE
jgi:hypothetical protein